MTEAVPWVKWYFDRWLNDRGLRLCSFAAKGLWADLLAIMHRCEPYGHLVINGHPPTAKEISAMIGGTRMEIAKLLEELSKNGVLSREEKTEIIFSRRMVRDNSVRQTNRSNGRLGGNPDLKTVKGGVAGSGQPPSPKGLRLEKEKEREREKERKIHGELTFAEFWKAYPRKVGKDAAMKAWDKAIQRALPEEIIAGLRRYQFSAEVQYQPHASTWLNEGRWKIEPDTPPPFVLTPIDPTFSPGAL